MGRPSSLTASQWAEAGRMLASGDSYSKVAKHFKVGKSTLVGRFSDRLETIKDVAQRLSTAEVDLERLPVSDQVSVRTLTEHLKGIANHAAKAAEAGMRTAGILQERALKTVQGIDDDSTPEDLRMADACLTVAGKASALGVSLMQANRDANKGQDRPTLEDLITGGK